MILKMKVRAVAVGLLGFGLFDFLICTLANKADHKA